MCADVRKNACLLIYSTIETAVSPASPEKQRLFLPLIKL